MMCATNRSTLTGGFSDPVANSQEIFRILLHAMSHPGRVLGVPHTMTVPRPLHGACASICLTLLDLDTPVWMDERARTPEVEAYLRFHCGCPFTEDPSRASFALITHTPDLPDLDRFSKGSSLYPDTSTTLIIQVGHLAENAGVQLSGPGIQGVTLLYAEGLSPSFWRELQANGLLFPQGVDVFLVSPTALCGLPRTVHMEG